uniref:(California timema) hypothetical protein n=1 Tax=Timema californicum TaxID=61474 RepID=A0A7R9JIT4_TIMCA|nr:unnamed protein product [Timema californicum]
MINETSLRGVRGKSAGSLRGSRTTQPALFPWSSTDQGPHSQPCSLGPPRIKDHTASPVPLVLHGSRITQPALFPWSSEGQGPHSQPCSLGPPRVKDHAASPVPLVLHESRITQPALFPWSLRGSRTTQPSLFPWSSTGQGPHSEPCSSVLVPLVLHGSRTTQPSLFPWSSTGQGPHSEPCSSVLVPLVLNGSRTTQPVLFPWSSTEKGPHSQPCSPGPPRVEDHTASPTPSLNSAYRRYFSGIKKADCLLAAKTRNSHFMRIVLEPAVPRRRPDLTSFLHKPLEHYRDILKLLQTILNNAKVTDDEYPALARVVREMQVT